MTLDLQPGVSFGDYFLERRLGGGGFGDVWLARNASGGYVALKVLNGLHQSSESARIRAEIEMLAAAASSSSRHIVRVLGGGSEPAPYVVMEYIEGVDLGRQIAGRGALPIPEVLKIATAVTDALGTLQLAGIIHRDVKPANVMIDKQGVVKLTDFGIAKIVGIDAATATSQMPMSMAYAAPEVWEGKASYLSDHYAFGALLYQCLCGRPPFTGNYAEIYRQHLQADPDLSVLPPDTPASLRKLIAACLAKDPEQRPPNAAAIQADLNAAEMEFNATLSQTVQYRPAQEPKQLGPWIIDHRSPDYAWTFVCHHEATYEDALVELHFAPGLEFGYALRKAVEVNPKLVPLGAERLVATSRFVLRPDEGWTNAPPGAFQFWVARSTVARQTNVNVTAEALHAAAGSLNSMIKLCADDGLNLGLRTDNIWMGVDGVHVERPGLPPYDDTDPYAAADAWLSAEIGKLSLAAVGTPIFVQPVSQTPPTPIVEAEVAPEIPTPVEAPSDVEATPQRTPSFQAPSFQAPSFQAPSFSAAEVASVETPSTPAPLHAWEQAPQSMPQTPSIEAPAFSTPASISVPQPEVAPSFPAIQSDVPPRELSAGYVAPEPRTPKRADFGRRMGAFLIDWVAIIVVWFLTFVLFGVLFAILGIDTSDEAPGWLIWPITLGVFPVYHFAFVAGPARRTLGMMALGLHVVLDRNRGDVTPTEALTRSVVLYFGSVFLIGCLWMLWDSDHLTLHDKASSTEVVYG